MADRSITDRELKQLCRAIGDISRMRIVRQLADGHDVNVTELARRLSMSQPLASWHLRILRRAGILNTRRDGRQVYCSLDRRRVSQFQQAIGGLIDSDRGKEQLWERSALPSSA